MAMKEEIISVEKIRYKLAPILKDEGLELILLFGSSVSRKIHRQSDIDLGFLFNKPVNILALTNRVIRLLQTDNIDVVDLRCAGPLLKFAITKNGILLYENQKGIFNKFYSLSFRMYVDSKKLRDAQKTAINHFLKSKGLS